ncbi:hypothetical protein A5791_06205 [Mycobacterium sp. 852002-51163_SCH5372311]|nr:hypothetical protein A5791_06205 [Mycobacterium sp. 852002-51163_SCH5372311]
MAGNRPPSDCAVVDGPKLCSLLAGVASDARLVEVPVSRRPWTSSGVRVKQGDRVTWLAWGRAYALIERGIGAGPSFGLLGRVEDGPVQMSARPTFTFTADRDGELRFGGRLPGELLSSGEVRTDRVPFRVIRGGFSAVVAVWPQGSDVHHELEQIVSLDSSGLCTIELQRLSDPPRPPDGWFYHPLLGHEEVYTSTDDGIQVDCCDTVAIIRHPVNVELDDRLRLRWSWRLDQLPSSLPENTILTHDYVSIAVEFDDGQDLTWYWSSTLPQGLSYRCPLDHWRHRETHIVVRSGTADLGRWVTDERPILADHQAAIGGRPPQRVVAVWLIATSLAQHNSAVGAFGSIELDAGTRPITVL